MKCFCKRFKRMGKSNITRINLQWKYNQSFYRLLITAKGLGLDEVVFNLLKVYSDPGNLVLVIGTNEEEEEYFIQRLSKEEIKAQPKKVTTEYSTSDRTQLYLNGGVLFVTTRILVVDMLMERVPMNLITGLMVYKAHKTAQTAQESFIIRLYRQKNKTGFIKAFSGSPIAFTAGFCQVNRIMRNLFVRNLFLWPRFHSVVTESLKKSTPLVIELRVDMTEAMKTIQTSILDLMHFTLQELKRLNPSFSSPVDEDTEDRMSVENAISKSFHKTLQQELEPIWHQLSWKTKQLVSDMKTLRDILRHLTNYDAITFYAFVSALRTTDAAMKSGGWMILDQAETLFMTSKSRVFGSESGGNDAAKKAKVQFDFEECPKWKVLQDIIEEIKTEIKKNESDDEKVLVIVSEERVRYQLQDLFTIGSESLLKRMFNKCLGEKYGLFDSEVAKEDKSKGKGKKSAPEEPVQNQELKSVLIQSLQIGSFAINRLIQELRPRYVILYDHDIGVVRQLEVFQADNPGFQIKVYFVMYSKSVEEQAYLSSIRQEKDAFEKLIREKETMVVPEEREGRDQSTNEDLYRGSEKASDQALSMLNTRRGGGQVQVQKSQKVIVDMREFRSELPSLLHKRGIDIDPVTLEVGDYILTPEICVERKSISDLIGSLNNGRLYNQATSMTRFYSRPMLLIEFDQNKPFALQGRYYLSKDIASSDLVQRLQLLTIHFPKLRILWSPSPHATTELFEELKRGREEPDASKAAAVSIDIIDDYNNDKFNPALQDFLSKLPGITTKNIYAILHKVNSLLELLTLSVEDLEELLGSKQCAQDLHESLHGDVKPVIDSYEVKRPNKGKNPGTSRFKTIKRK